MLIPLKQGLKHSRQIKDKRDKTSLNVDSIKTRIETFSQTRKPAQNKASEC